MASPKKPSGLDVRMGVRVLRDFDVTNSNSFSLEKHGLLWAASTAQ